MPPDSVPGAGTAWPRVLLVDDDASVRRLVAMALEGLPLDLLSCADGAAALAQLQAGPVRVLITDLMMPGVSGLELLSRLAHDPGLRQGAELVVFSAGIDAAMRERLQGLGVQRMLAKPVSLRALEDVVMAAVADSSAGLGAQNFGAQTLGAQHAAATDAGAHQAVAAGHAAPADESRAIALHFGGDAGLFHAFRQTCLPQFRADLAAGEAAIARQDAAALRRLAHSLKSVLATLGHAGAAEKARATEAAAATGDLAAAQPPWAALRQHLQALATLAP